MVRSTSISAATTRAMCLATGVTLSIYYYLYPLYKSSSSSTTDEESLWHKYDRQFSAILLFFVTFCKSFKPFGLKISDAKVHRIEHEDTKKAKTEEQTCNLVELVKLRVELVTAKTALKKEQERVNRIEQVMESLQAQVGVLRASLTVKDAEAKNKRKREQAMEADCQRKGDILAKRIMIQEETLEKLFKRLDTNEDILEAVVAQIEELIDEGNETKKELKRFDRKIDDVDHHFNQEVDKIQKTAKENLEELQTDLLAAENYWGAEFVRLEDTRKNRELDLKEEIKVKIKNDLAREQKTKEIDEFWEEKYGKGPVTEEQLIAIQEAEDKMYAEVTNTASRIKQFLQTKAELVEKRVDQEGDAEMKDLENGKNDVLEDITHELEDGAEVEEEDSGSDEEWTELGY
ncbi:hypothetical protein EAE96_003972 [Botrytis aclada]|nr:hypothetical protein EAE96_003972 [Botrytis aclada]